MVIEWDVLEDDLGHRLAHLVFERLVELLEEVFCLRLVEYRVSEAGYTRLLAHPAPELGLEVFVVV